MIMRLRARTFMVLGVLAVAAMALAACPAS